jgi:hypothetical protein
MSAKHGTHSRYSQGCRCDARTDDYSLLQCWQAITSIRCQFAPLRSTFVAVTRAPHVRGVAGTESTAGSSRPPCPSI